MVQHTNPSLNQFTQALLDIYLGTTWYTPGIGSNT